MYVCACTGLLVTLPVAETEWLTRAHVCVCVWAGVDEAASPEREEEGVAVPATAGPVNVSLLAVCVSCASVSVCVIVV